MDNGGLTRSIRRERNWVWRRRGGGYSMPSAATSECEHTCECDFGPYELAEGENEGEDGEENVKT
jgi:hypothetical protein